VLALNATKEALLVAGLQESNPDFCGPPHHWDANPPEARWLWTRLGVDSGPHMVVTITSGTGSSIGGGLILQDSNVSFGVALERRTTFSHLE
jgi:hypothetical protein